MSITTIPYTARGHAGVVDASFNRQFFLDSADNITRVPWVVAAGQVLAAGSVMGVESTNDTLVLSDPTASNGSEEPFAIILEDIDTSASGLNANAEISVLTFSGSTINLNALVYDGNWDVRKLVVALKKAGFPAIRTPFESAL